MTGGNKAKQVFRGKLLGGMLAQVINRKPSRRRLELGICLYKGMMQTYGATLQRHSVFSCELPCRASAHFQARRIVGRALITHSP